MYDLPDFYLVANPIDRYSIGDRTPGLLYGDDGALTIVVQHDEPSGADDRANWLPTPAGPFRRSCACTSPKTLCLTAHTNYRRSPAPRDRTLIGGGELTMARGGCLCGAVRYEVQGPLRDVLICHCEECRRWHGHVSATTAAR